MKIDKEKLHIICVDHSNSHDRESRQATKNFSYIGQGGNVPQSCWWYKIFRMNVGIIQVDNEIN